MEKTRKWRYGINRWIILLLLIALVVIMIFVPRIQPHIQVAPENITREPLFSLPVLGDFYLTNTLVAMVLMDIILLGIGYAVYRTIKKGDLVPYGLAGAMEALLEVIYNLTESSAGKWARKIFPYFATISLMVVVSNLMEMLPGVDSIGVLEESPHGNPLWVMIPGFMAAVVQGSAEHLGEGYVVVPYVRVLSTDLNFTAALAVVSVAMTQVIGFQAQGWRYLIKFFNFTTLISKPVFGLIDLLVGLLEIISEFSKVLSFTFRLFGNIFAGSVLLFLLGTMLPFMQSGMMLFEFFIGMIQAVVFGMLTMIFMSQATHGHGAEEHHE